MHFLARTCRLAAVALHGLTPEVGIVFQPLFRFCLVSCVVLFLADSATLRVMTAQRGATRGYSDDVTLVKATCAVPYCRYCGSRKSHQPPVHAWAVCVRARVCVCVCVFKNVMTHASGADLLPFIRLCVTSAVLHQAASPQTRLLSSMITLGSASTSSLLSSPASSPNTGSSPVCECVRIASH